MNPLERTREAAVRAWGKSRRGTTRTALWVKDGITDSAGSARDRVSGLRSKPDQPASATADVESDGGGPGIRERIGATNLVERARADQRIAIAWGVAGILLVAWIGWTIYVWAENGSTAGLGVLISWPVVFAAAAIVATPFVGAGVLVHRHRLAADGAPSLEGEGEGETDDEEEDEETPEDEADDDASDDDEAEVPDEDAAEDDEPEDQDEEDEAEDDDSDEESEDAA